MSLVLHNLGKRYGNTAVFQGVNLAVAPGEFVAIVGESGHNKYDIIIIGSIMII